MNISARAIQDLKEQLAAADRDARALVADLAEEQGRWRAETSSWSVAECLDHLASANRVYLEAMKEPAIRAREQRRFRRRAASPGLAGRWFVKMLEPPVKAPFRMRAPRSIEPRVAPALSDAFATFAASQNEVRAFLCANEELDLTAVRFPNPFVRGIRFSLASGLHVVTAHERRHLWQAWRIRRAAEHAAAQVSPVETNKQS